MTWEASCYGPQTKDYLGVTEIRKINTKVCKFGCFTLGSVFEITLNELRLYLGEIKHGRCITRLLN